MPEITPVEGIIIYNEKMNYKIRYSVRHYVHFDIEKNQKERKYAEIEHYVSEDVFFYIISNQKSKGNLVPITQEFSTNNQK